MNNLLQSLLIFRFLCGHRFSIPSDIYKTRLQFLCIHDLILFLKSDSCFAECLWYFASLQQQMNVSTDPASGILRFLYSGDSQREVVSLAVVFMRVSLLICDTKHFRMLTYHLCHRW